MAFAFTLSTVLLALLTLLPMSSVSKWWVRAADFPRLQMFTLLTLNLMGICLWVDDGMLLSLINAACLGVQLWWILPYTSLFPHEVASTKTPDPKRTIRLMSANVLTSNHHSKALLNEVRQYRPDILITLESDQWWQEQLDSLEQDYPHRMQCPLDNLYGMHVYSRLPLSDCEVAFLVEPDVPSMHAMVTLPSGDKVRLHCLHPAPPSPTENEESDERDAELVMVGKAVAKRMQQDNIPVIVSGDLNDVAWSTTTRLFRKLSGLLDPRIGRGMFNTYHAQYWPVRWPLDHVFHSHHFSVNRLERLAYFGSDHFPLLAELVLAPQQRAAPQDDDAGLQADDEDEALAENKLKTEDVRPDQVPKPG